MTYDWSADAYQSWLLAIREKRLQGVRDGRYTPINDEERAIAPKVTE